MSFKAHLSLLLLCLTLAFVVNISGYKVKINGGTERDMTFAELHTIANNHKHKGNAHLRSFVKNVTTAHDKHLRKKKSKCVGRTLILSFACSGCNLQMGLQNQIKTFVRGLFFASLTNRTLCVHRMKSDYMRAPDVLWSDVLDFPGMNKLLETIDYPRGLSKVSVETYREEDVKYASCLHMRSVPHHRRDYSTKIPECEKLGMIDAPYSFTAGDALYQVLKRGHVASTMTLFVGPWNLFRYHRTPTFNYDDFNARLTASLRFSPIVYDYVAHLKVQNHLCDAGCTKKVRYAGVHLRLEDDFLNYTFGTAKHLYQALGWLELPKESNEHAAAPQTAVLATAVAPQKPAAARAITVAAQSTPLSKTSNLWLNSLLGLLRHDSPTNQTHRMLRSASTPTGTNTSTVNGNGAHRNQTRHFRELDPRPYFDYQISEFLAFVEANIPPCRGKYNASSCFDGPIFIASGLGKVRPHYADDALAAVRALYGANKVVAVTTDQLLLADTALKAKYGDRRNTLYGKFASGRELLALLDLIISSDCEIFLTQVYSSFSHGLASFSLEPRGADYVNYVTALSISASTDTNFTMGEFGGNGSVLVKSFAVDDRAAFWKLYADNKNTKTDSRRV